MSLSCVWDSLKWVWGRELLPCVGQFGVCMGSDYVLCVGKFGAGLEK